jgi:23S rRNA-/tRNA-specific pseudouridylate synthase
MIGDGSVERDLSRTSKKQKKSTTSTSPNFFHQLPTPLWPLHGQPPLRCGPVSLEVRELMERRILYQSEEYVIIDKPPDVSMDTSSGCGEDVGTLVTCESLARHWIPSLASSNICLQWCHRLDHGTSGVLLLALNKTAAATACEAFADRTTLKTYSAVASGIIRPESFPWIKDIAQDGLFGEGNAVGESRVYRDPSLSNSCFVIDAPLGPMTTDFRMQIKYPTPNSNGRPLIKSSEQLEVIRMIPKAKEVTIGTVDNKANGGKGGKKKKDGMFKSAMTLVEVVGYGVFMGHPVTHLHLTPRTGRRHQLRVHLASIGHSLVQIVCLWLTFCICLSSVT